MCRHRHDADTQAIAELMRADSCAILVQHADEIGSRADNFERRVGILQGRVEKLVLEGKVVRSSVHGTLTWLNDKGELT